MTNFKGQFEQLDAFTKELSPVLWNYYSLLTREGFSEEQAFQLAKDFQQMTARKGE